MQHNFGKQLDYNVKRDISLWFSVVVLTNFWDVQLNNRYVASMSRKVLKNIVEVLILVPLWMFMLVALLLMVPFFLVALLIRTIEAAYYHFYHDAVKLSNKDVLFTMGTTKNPLVIHACLQINGILTKSKLNEILFERLTSVRNNVGDVQYPTAQMYLHEGLVNYYWIKESRFNIDDHIIEGKTLSALTETAIQDAVSQYCTNVKVDSKKSPWEFIIVPCVDDNGLWKTILFLRMAHILSDGSALSYFLLHRFADQPIQTFPLQRFTQIDRTLLTIKGCVYLPLSYSKMMLLKRDNHVLHTENLTGKKRIAWSKPLKLSFIKNIKSILSLTINDILIGNLTTTLKEYFNSDYTGGFTVLFPVDLRSASHVPNVFENDVAGITMRLPLNTQTATEAVRSTAEIIEDIKWSGTPFGVDMGWYFISTLFPRGLSKAFVFNTVNKTSAAVSNLVGPIVEVALDGMSIDWFTFWPPQTANQAMGISFCSYKDEMRIGLQVDEAVMDDPYHFIDMYVAQLEKLQNQP